MPLTVPPLSRRAADEFARALEGRANIGPQLAPFVDVVDELSELGRSVPGPSPAFRETLWHRLSELDVRGMDAPSMEHSAGDDQQAAQPSGPMVGWKAGRPGWRRRLAVSGLAVGVLIGVATGAALASASALPGDALYGVKRTVEEVRLALADSDAAKGRRYLEVAGARLDEIHRLVERYQETGDSSKIDWIAHTFADMQQATERSSKLLIGSYEQSHDRAVLVTLLDAIEHQRAEIDAIQSIAPSELQDESATVRALLELVTTDILNHDPLVDVYRNPGASPDDTVSSGNGGTPAQVPGDEVSAVVHAGPRPDAVEQPTEQDSAGDDTAGDDTAADESDGVILETDSGGSSIEPTANTSSTEPGQSTHSSQPAAPGDHRRGTVDRPGTQSTTDTDRSKAGGIEQRASERREHPGRPHPTHPATPRTAPTPTMSEDSEPPS